MSIISKREFAGGAAFAAAAAQPSADRLRVGVIGCGGRALGLYHHAAQDERGRQGRGQCGLRRLRQARAEGGAVDWRRAYQNYRELLANKDVDVVGHRHADHWHGQMAIDAASAGKHIYCEKPMTHSVEEAKRVVAKIRETGVKMQVGVQAMSDDSYETAYKYVQDGTIGKVVIAQIDYSRNYRDDFWLKPVDPDIKPGVNFNWDLFLGPAQKRPFDAERYFNWIRYFDYSGGVPAGLFVHRVTRLIKALGLKFPEYGSAHGGKFEFSGSKAEVPDTINIMLDFLAGDCHVDLLACQDPNGGAHVAGP